MRKIIVIILSIFISSGVLFAYSNPQLEKGLNTLGEMMKQRFSKQEQIQRYSAVQQILFPMIKQKSGKQRQDFAYILGRLDGRIKELKNNKIEIETFEKGNPEQQKNLSNIDIAKIQKTWVSRHNSERKKLGLQDYTLHEKLSHSAFVWAKHLSTLGTWSHKRKPTDGFYNYESIKERFTNLGVYFSGKGTLFTESIALGNFSCKENDCTDILLRGMKKNFNFFLNEKRHKESWKRTHYRAIVHNYFNTIGVGVYQKNGKYYLVSHYGRDVY